jgi:hypothetical protein
MSNKKTTYQKAIEGNRPSSYKMYQKYVDEFERYGKVSDESLKFACLAFKNLLEIARDPDHGGLAEAMFISGRRITPAARRRAAIGGLTDLIQNKISKPKRNALIIKTLGGPLFGLPEAEDAINPITGTVYPNVSEIISKSLKPEKYK